MSSPRKALLAGVIGVLLAFCATAAPAFASDLWPGSGTLTWSSPSQLR